MANRVFNIAKGRVNELVHRVVNNDPVNSGLVIVLLKSVEIDATLEDYDNLQDLLAAAGNVECDFTNYARIQLIDSDLTSPVPDDANDRQDGPMTNQTWPNAGGVLDNNTVKALVCYDSDITSGDDSSVTPLTAQDFVSTTDGTDLILQATGFFRAS